ncbi:serine/threonine kinase Pkn10 [gamma proteobacterium NOR5-3]|nr:serine/threonine kinase Pkn10 [gamma proteobacterium NOR5-3]
MTDATTLARLTLALPEAEAEAEREQFLRASCGDDDRLLKTVTGLLPEMEGRLIGHLPANAQVGPYYILEHLDDGSMGSVYLAEQREPVERLVALKILRPSVDSEQILNRFEGESRALALMSHPNVASVIDAGKAIAGQPYFAMEYVDGKPITDYSDSRRLTLEQRVELFLQICNGVAHAHQKGVIHRDLKPGNILVTEVDDKPLVKIIDFGLAKSVERKLSVRTVHTQLGSFVGTPLYSSPEQIMGSDDVDTRCDVYSLGVILYELITGTLPLNAEIFERTEDLKQLVTTATLPPSSGFARLEEGKEDIASNRGLNASALEQRSEIRHWLDSDEMPGEGSHRSLPRRTLAYRRPSGMSHRPPGKRPRAYICISPKEVFAAPPRGCAGGSGGGACDGSRHCHDAHGLL